MASTLRIAVVIEQDGVALPGSPFLRSLTVDEAVPFLSLEKDATNDATYSQLGPALIDNIQAFFLTTDKAVKLRLDGQTNGQIELNPGAMILIVNSTIDAGASTNVTVNNGAAVDAANVAHLSGIAAGT